MESSFGNPPQWIRFLFSPHMPPELIWPVGPREGAIARGLLAYMERLLAGRAQGLKRQTRGYSLAQLDAIFADDAGMDWDELAACRDELAGLRRMAPNADRREARKLAAEFVDNFLLLEVRDSSRLIKEVAAFVASCRYTPIARRNSTNGSSMHVKFRYLFEPLKEWSFRLMDEGNLAQDIADCIQSDFQAQAEVSRDTTALGKVREMLKLSRDPDELVACNAEIGRLLDPVDDPDEKTLRRRAEEFVDDYLIMQADVARRFMEDVVSLVRNEAKTTGADTHAQGGA